MTVQVAVGVRLNVNCDQLIIVKLVSVQFVMTMPVSINHVTSSEKSTVMVNQVFVYQILLPVSVTVGAALSIRFTMASIEPVSTPHEEYSNRKFPLLLKICVSHHAEVIVS